MKKVLSIILILALVFSICTFSLTANAETKYVQVMQVSDSEGRFDITAERISKSDFDKSHNYRLTIYEHLWKGTISLAEIEDLLDEFVAEADENILPNIRELFVSIYRPGDISDIYASIFTKMNPRGMTVVLLNGNDYGKNKSDKTYVDLSMICDYLLSSCKDSLQTLGISALSYETLENRFYTSFPKLDLNELFIGMDPDLIGFKEGGLDAGWNGYDYYITAYTRAKGTYCVDETELRTILNGYLDRINNSIADKSYIAYIYDPVAAWQLISWYNSTTGSSPLRVDIAYVYGDNSYFVQQVCLVNKEVISGDPNFDEVVDTFDVAITTEYVNTFDDPENEGVMMAMDVVEDGYIDATDLAYITYIANYEG